MRNYYYYAFTLLFFLSSTLYGQDKKWDVNDPPGTYKEVELSLTEGTWMNLDVSPDGKTIVFDLLGDLYTLPIEGGTATPIRTGLAFDLQPRFSPDGEHILFTSDAGGGDNLWMAKPDGSEARQITKETFRLLNNGVWMPDGEYIVGRKHFTSRRSLGAGEMWMYHISGGSGVQLTKRKNDQQDVNEPCVSPDGQYVYFSEDMYPGGFFQYNKDPNKQIYTVRRYDCKTGKVENITGGPGGASRPQISRDGKKLAFIKRVRTQTVLFIHDLETGQEFPIYSDLSKDQQEGWAIFGTYPGFSWMPDDKAIVIWAKGKLQKVDIEAKSATEIPFELTAKHKLAETVKFEQSVFTKDFEVKVLRHLVTAPNEEYVVFNALGHLWKSDVSRGKPERLTEDAHFEFEPSFDAEGKRLVYVSWDDEAQGGIHILNLETGSKTTLDLPPAIYRTPSFSPDGQKIVFAKEGGNYHQGYQNTKNAGIYEVSIAEAEAKLLLKSGQNPQYSQDGSKVFIQQRGGGKKIFVYLDLETLKVHEIFSSKYTTRFVPSPDNKWIAFKELFNVYIAALPMHGKSIDLSAKIKSIPVAKVSRDAGINLHWSADSKTLHWTLGNEYFSEPLSDRFSFVEGAEETLPAIDTTGTPIILSYPSDKPEGLIAFTNAHIITMEGEEVIENGTVIVEDNVIKKVGISSEVRIPAAAKVYDLEGKTLMPGFIDTHAHLGAFRFGLSPQKHWQYHANLAYGVTATHDPSSNTEMTFAQSEMVKAGQMIGPRIFSTGTILYGADGDFKAVINSLDDARSAVRRTKAYGAFSVKSYNQPRRNQRQQVIQASRELGIMVYPEGGSTFFHNLSMIIDGHTSIEHNIPVAPLYEDVLSLWSKTGTANTPTLVVNFAGMSGEYYWYQHTNVWEKERLLSFTPRGIVDSRARHRTMLPEEEYVNGHILTAQSCTELQRRGVDICVGSHGQLQGLAFHWEMWNLHQGGMTNMEALRSATLNGARYIGMEKEIGSIKEGKLADMVVLKGNPLENLHETEHVVYTMVNGRLYDAATLNEIGNYDKERTKFYWELPGSGNAYPLHAATNSFMQPQCSCRH